MGLLNAKTSILLKQPRHFFSMAMSLPVFGVMFSQPVILSIICHQLSSKIKFLILFLFSQSPHPISPRVFGSTCFVHNISPGLDKLLARSIKCVFLGYHRSQKGYRSFPPTLNRYFISADVSFFELVPYFEFVSTSSDIEQSIPLGHTSIPPLPFVS